MLSKLRKAFPGLYEYYLHLRRLKTIRRINKLKRMPRDKYPELLREKYEMRVGKPLDWNNITSYTAKMQWEKLYHYDPRKAQLSDKYLVRDWVKEKVGEEYLIPLLGVWNKFDDIDFDTLPDKFVLKTNHGSGTNIIVRDKSKLKRRDAKRKINDWLKTDYAYTTGFELHYTDIARKIIAEKYIESTESDLQDYKFLCFDGKPHFCWVDIGRYTKHVRNVYDMNWNLQSWNQGRYGNSEIPIDKPENFDKMVEIVTALCEGFAHVRVDLYNVDGKIYFGEMTFTNGSGFGPIVPDEYDEYLGGLWKLDMTEKNNSAKTNDER